MKQAPYGHGALPPSKEPGGYNPVAVSKAIASSRQKIGGKEAKLIHALLKGRG